METANGKKYTAAEVDHLILLLPPQYQGPARSQPQAAVQLLSQVLFYQRLAEEATKDEVDKRSPYKEQVEFARTSILANAELMLHHNSIVVKEEDREKLLQRASGPVPGGQGSGDSGVVQSYARQGRSWQQDPSERGGSQSEDRGSTKADRGRRGFRQAGAGHSDDVASAGKDGDFGSMKRNSPYPDPIKNAVFALKPGEMSEPIRQPTGFWLIRLEDLKTQPYGEVGDQINAQIQQEQFQAWQKSVLLQYMVKVDNPAYFAPKPAPAQLQQVR